MSDFSLLLSMVLDVSLVVLLTIGVIVAFMLNRRLKSFKIATQHINLALEKLETFRDEADESLISLKQTAYQFDKNYLSALTKAENLRDELSFIVERGESSVVRLDDYIREARKIAPQQVPQQEMSEETLDEAYGHEEDEKQSTLFKNHKTMKATEVEKKLIQTLRAAK